MAGRCSSRHSAAVDRALGFLHGLIKGKSDMHFNDVLFRTAAERFDLLTIQSPNVRAPLIRSDFHHRYRILAVMDD